MFDCVSGGSASVGRLLLDEAISANGLVRYQKIAVRVRPLSMAGQGVDPRSVRFDSR